MRLAAPINWRTTKPLHSMGTLAHRAPGHASLREISLANRCTWSAGVVTLLLLTRSLWTLWQTRDLNMLNVECCGAFAKCRVENYLARRRSDGCRAARSGSGAKRHASMKEQNPDTNGVDFASLLSCEFAGGATVTGSRIQP